MICCTLLGSYSLEGYFVDGMPNGFCRWIWDDGLMYIGKIQNGLFEGKGEMINGKPYAGTKIIGTFKNGKILAQDGEIRICNKNQVVNENLNKLVSNGIDK